MKERIHPWSERREEVMRDIPLRHLEQGVMGMHEIMALYPDVRILADDAFKEQAKRRVDLAVYGCEEGSDEWYQRRNDAYDAFVQPLADRAETSEERQRVKELVDDLVAQWRSLARCVRIDEIDLFTPSFDFMYGLLDSSEVRKKLWNMGCRALDPVYNALSVPYASQALKDEDGEFHCDEDSRANWDDICDAAYVRALNAYDRDPESFIEDIDNVSDSHEFDDEFDDYDDLLKTGWNGGDRIHGLLNHVHDEVITKSGCYCSACQHFSDGDFVSLFRAFGSFILSKNFGNTDEERDLIVAMFKQHVGTQDYGRLRERAAELTKCVPEESARVNDVFNRWLEYLVVRGGLAQEEADGLKERVEKALTYVGKHAVVVNADPMESALRCTSGDYDSGTHVIRVRYYEEREYIGDEDDDVDAEADDDDYDEDNDGDEDDDFGFDIDAQRHSASRGSIGHSVDTIRHELIHAASGHGLLYEADEIGLADMQVGLQKYHRFAWLNEAFTEFFTRCIARVDREQSVDIDAALTESFAYDDERQLVGEILRHPNIDVHKAMGRLTMAFFEDVGAGKSVQYFNEVNRMFSDVYGAGFLVKLDDYILRVTAAKKLEDHTVSWGYGVGVALKEWRKWDKEFSDDRFARIYIADGVYQVDYPKISTSKKTQKEIPQ